MKIIAVDDEARAIRMLKILLEEIPETEFLGGFSGGAEALAFLQKNDVDLLFLDVEMPGTDGLALAGKLQTLLNPPNIVFVTGFKQYALDAWTVGAVDYVLKPFGLEDIKEALERCKRFRRVCKEKQVEVRCFPGFDLFIDGTPLVFHNKKAKELLAFLIHHDGEWVDINQIVYTLFEDKDEAVSKNNYRSVVYRLRQGLLEAGIPELLETGYGKCRVNTNRFVCDYYRYLAGERQLFHGEYLNAYSWAETELARMLRIQEEEG